MCDSFLCSLLELIFVLSDVSVITEISYRNSVKMKIRLLELELRFSNNVV